MKKSIFKITTLLLLLCAAICSVVGLVACSSEEEGEVNPLIGSWIGTCTNTHHINNGEGHYYINITSDSSMIGVGVTSAFKSNGETTYTIRERSTRWFSEVTSDSYGDYSGKLDLSGYDTAELKTCIIIKGDNDDTFTLIEYYTDSQTYTYTFERTTLTKDEWKANPTGSAS